MTNEKKLLEEIQSHLDQSTDTLDAGTLSKITAARNRALEQQRSFRLRWGMPLTGIAAAAAAGYLAVSLFTGQEVRHGVSPDPEHRPAPITVDRTSPREPNPLDPKGPEKEPGVQVADSRPKPSIPAQPDPSLTNDDIPPEPSPVIQPHQVELVALLTSDRELEFYENIEFYTWLAENPDEIAGS